MKENENPSEETVMEKRSVIHGDVDGQQCDFDYCVNEVEFEYFHGAGMNQSILCCSDCALENFCDPDLAKLREVIADD